ncbi:MAG: helix-turn-helix transcriptional regulator [Firmicutes bacterium]|nr:helix-turn-helix transcriptional regulator [Bacillota bacterium]
MGGFFRIGDKLLNRDKLDRIVDRIFQLRVSGLSQQEVATRVGCDRSFVSRLESLAEVRKGGSVAVIGFPLGNTSELARICQELGVEYTLLLNDLERWELIESHDGKSLLNWLMQLMLEMGEYDHVIMIGSDMRIKLAEGIVGDKVLGVVIGESPIEGDVHYSPEKLRELITSIKGEY